MKNSNSSCSGLIFMIILGVLIVAVTKCPSKSQKEADQKVEPITVGGFTYYLGPDNLGNIVLSDDETGALSRFEQFYVCSVGPGVPSDLVIPDEYDGIPVALITSSYTDGDHPAFDSVTIGNNTVCIHSFLYNDECGNLTEIVIPDSVKIIAHSFNNCSMLTDLTLTGNITDIDRSFTNCISLKELQIPDGIDSIKDSFTEMSDATVNISGSTNCIGAFDPSRSVTVITDHPGMIRVSPYDMICFEAVTPEMRDYSDQVDQAEIVRMARRHFCEDLDPSKEVLPKNAHRYANFLDGPFVTTLECPELNYHDYMAMFSNTLFSTYTNSIYSSVASTYTCCSNDSCYEPDMTAAPEIYFVVERMQGSWESYSGNGSTYSFCHMFYRISVWEIESDELVCWFTVETGAAPNTTTSVTSISFSEGEVSYLNESDHSRPTPVNVLVRYFSPDGS